MRLTVRIVAPIALVVLAGCSSGADEAQLAAISNRLEVIEAKQDALLDAIEQQQAELAEVKDLVDGIDTLVENIDCGK